MSKLKTAVVGVGYLGNFHAQKHKANPQIELVGVCDHFAEQADKVAGSLGVKSFHRPQDLIGKVEAVTIAASTQSHYELAKVFISEGVHVNIEKPITATLAQAEEILNLAAKKNVKIAVGHIERFNPAIVNLRQRLNKPLSFEFKRFASFKARGADVSVLHDLMIHDMDLLTWLSGSEIEHFEVSGLKLITKEWDSVNASFVMKNGIQGFIQVSRVSPVAERSIRVQQQGSILFANTGSLELESVSAGPDLNTDPLKVEKWTIEKADALQRETDAFVAAILGQGSLVVTGQDGFDALKNITLLEQALEKSVKNG